MNTDGKTFTVPVTGKYKMGDDGIKFMNNNDRLLTRVYDKQEKKMLYTGDTFFYLDKEYSYAALDEKSIIVYRWTDSLDHPDDGKVDFILFGNRFVPMMCLGRKDKNKKLIFSSDIIKKIELHSDDGRCTRHGEITNGIVKYSNKYCTFTIFDQSGNEYTPDLAFSIIDNLNDLEIIGNKFEQPELLEVKE